MQEKSNDVFRFSEFALSPRERRLSHGKENVLLTPKAFDLLRYSFGTMEASYPGASYSRLFGQAFTSPKPTSPISSCCCERVWDPTQSKRFLSTATGWWCQLPESLGSSTRPTRPSSAGRSC